MSTAIAVTAISVAILELAAIALLISRNLAWQNSANEWENAARLEYEKAFGALAKAQDAEMKAVEITHRYAAKDKECERIRAEKSAINARYEDLIAKVTTVGLDRNARHDVACNYVIRGNMAAEVLESEIKRRDSLLEQALQSGRKVEDMSKEEIKESIQEKRENGIAHPVCTCGSNLPVIRLKDGSFSTCCDSCMPF